jgi:hypothetical protein
MKRIDWLQLIILPIAIAIMVVSWVEPWAQWAVLSTGIERVGQVPPPGVMMIVILASTVVTRRAVRDTQHQRRLIVLGGLLAIVVVTLLTYVPLTRPMDFLRNLLDWQNSVAPELLTAMVVALLWWRGILIGRSRSLVEENLERTFLNGVLALAFLILVNHFSRRLTPSDVLAATLIFFAVSLSTLTIVNVELARAQQPEAGSWLKRQRHWFAIILGVVSAILLGGLLLATIFSPDVLREFISSIGPAASSAADGLARVLRPLFTFLFWLISPLVPLLEAILRVVLEGIMGVLQVIHQLGVQFNVARAQDDLQKFLDSPEFATFSRGTAVVLLLILFAVAAIWALRRSGLLSRRNPDETRESIASRELLRKQLKNFLNRLRRKQAADRALYLPLSGAGARRAVRQAYQEFLEWARSRNLARGPQQTPDQYARHLDGLSAALGQPVNDLTALYLRARYANDELTSEEAQAAQSALVRLQQTPVIQSPLSEE